MIIHLPIELESSVRSLVQAGRFASEDQLISEAVRAFLRRRDLAQTQAVAPDGGAPGSFIGSMRDAAEELDEIVAETMRDRRGWSTKL